MTEKKDKKTMYEFRSKMLKKLIEQIFDENENRDEVKRNNLKN